MAKISTAGAKLQIETGTTSGTGTLASSGTTVTGTSTDFTNELIAGDGIIVSGERYIVTAIASGTSLSIDRTPDTAFSTSSFAIATMSNAVAANSFTGPDISVDEVEVSDYDSSGYKDYIAGLREGGNISFGLWYQPKQSVHAQFLSDANSGTNRFVRFWLPDSVAGTAVPDVSNSRFMQVAFITQFSVEAQTNNAVSSSVGMRIRRAPQLIVGVDS